MLYKKIIFFIFFSYGSILSAQNSLAKIEYSYAEEAFNKKEYTKALKHIEEVKNLLGSTNARILFLEILSRDNSLPNYQAFNNNYTVNTINTMGSIFLKKIPVTPELLFRVNSLELREIYIDVWTSNVKFLKTRKKSKQTKEDLSLYTYLLSKLQSGQNITSNDFFPSTYNNVNSKKNVLNKENPNSEINNWLESAELINSLCDTYIANFENDVPIEKLKKIYEIKKQNKIYISNRELIESSWKFFINKEYKFALGKFIELESLGISSEQIIKKIKRIQVANSVVTSIAKNMVFVEGNQSKNEEILDLYVSKFEITSPQFFSIMNLVREEYSPNHMKALQNCEDCPLRLKRTSAERFIKKLNQLSEKKYRLPTKEEWFWFATGGVKTTDEERGKNKEKVKNIEKYAWFIKNTNNAWIIKSTNNGRGIKDPNSMIHQVGLKEPNELGLYDIWGNLAEFTTTNAVGGSIGTSKKKLVRGSNYAYSYDWDNEPINNNVIRLVLTADKTKE